MKKLIALAAFVAAIFAGCCLFNDDPAIDEQQKIEATEVSTNFQASGRYSGFADERYVWEALQFPTNRVIDRK